MLAHFVPLSIYNGLSIRQKLLLRTQVKRPLSQIGSLTLAPEVTRSKNPLLLVKYCENNNKNNQFLLQTFITDNRVHNHIDNNQYCQLHYFYCFKRKTNIPKLRIT